MARGAAVEFFLLGPLEVRLHGKPAKLGGQKQRGLLAQLLLNADEVVPTARLIDELWGERPPPSAANSVHVYVSQLRKVFGDGRLATRQPAISSTSDRTSSTLAASNGSWARGARFVRGGMPPSRGDSSVGHSPSGGDHRSPTFATRSSRRARSRDSRSFGSPRSRSASRPISSWGWEAISFPSSMSWCAPTRCASGYELS